MGQTHSWRWRMKLNEIVMGIDGMGWQGMVELGYKWHVGWLTWNAWHGMVDDDAVEGWITWIFLGLIEVQPQ